MHLQSTEEKCNEKISFPYSPVPCSFENTYLNLTLLVNMPLIDKSDNGTVFFAIRHFQETNYVVHQYPKYSIASLCNPVHS